MQVLQDPSLRKNRALFASVVASFLMLLVSAALTFHISRQSVAADEVVVHTLEVQQALGRTLLILGGAESGLRGFLLTGNEAFLRPHREAGDTLPGQLALLKKLVAADPAQRANAEALAPLIEQRLADIDDAVRAQREGRREDAVATLERAGLPVLNEIRSRIEIMSRIEGEELSARHNTVAALRERFINAVVVLLVACGILAVFALISVRRYLSAVHESRLRLASHNAELEERVQARTEELAQLADEANRERARAESLLTDVNHRVGNNLALVSSFLTMQQRAVKNPDAARALTAARARVQAIASAHRKLRLGADFATVKVNEVLGAVLDDIGAGLPPGDLIRIHTRFEALEINARDAVSLGVLTSELVMNAVKHAFAPGDGGEVSVTLERGADSVPVLEVADDGVGWHETHTQETGGLGAKIIDMVSRQFGGRPERSARQQSGAAAHGRGPGTCIRVNLSKLQVTPGA